VSLLALDLPSVARLLSRALKASASCLARPGQLIVGVQGLRIRVPVVGATKVRLRLAFSAPVIEADRLLVKYKVLSALGLPFSSNFVSRILSWSGAGSEYGVTAQKDSLSIDLAKLKEKRLLPEFLEITKIQFPTAERPLLVLRFGVEE